MRHWRTPFGVESRRCGNASSGSKSAPGRRKALVLAAMEEAGIKKLVEADFTLSLRPGLPKLIVIDETLIPEEFWRPQAPRLDRQWLLAALKNGRSVPGADLGNPEPTLAVRRS
jgi:Gp157 protein